MDDVGHFHYQVSDCDEIQAGEDDICGGSLSSSLRTTESLTYSGLCCKESFMSPASDTRGDQFEPDSAWPSISSGSACAVAAQPAVGIIPWNDSLFELIRQELAAEKQLIRQYAAGCLRAQAPPCIWAEHRRVLCEWMLALCSAAGMTRETFCLAASLLDRYITECCAAMGDKGYPTEGTLQLLAMACLSLAMKYEEVAPLHCTDLLRLAVNPATGALLYSAGDLGRMEWLVLQMVSWQVRVPTPTSFLMLLLPACGAAASSTASLSYMLPCGFADSNSSELVQWATRLLDVCVLRAPELPFPPSTIALACLLLAERHSGGGSNRILQLLSGVFPQQQLEQCVEAMEALSSISYGATALANAQQQRKTDASPVPAPTVSCAPRQHHARIAASGLAPNHSRPLSAAAGATPVKSTGYDLDVFPGEGSVWLIHKECIVWAQERASHISLCFKDATDLACR